MKKYIVVFDFKLYDERILIEAENKEQAIQKADAVLENRNGYMTFWYKATAEEV